MEYSIYKCRSCKKEFVLVNDDIESNIRQGKYISCPYCGIKKIAKGKESDSLKECMSSRSYIRKRGALIQK